MLSRMKRKFMNLFNRIPIIKRITIIYTLSFSLTLLVASLIIISLTTAGLNRAAKIEVGETLDSVSTYIERGGSISVPSIIDQNSNPFVDVEIIDDKTGEHVVRIFRPHPIVRDRGSLKPVLYEDIRQLHRSKTVLVDTNSYTVNVYRKMARDRDFIAGLLWLFAVANVIGFVAAYFASGYLSAKIIKPIKQMTETARLISASDLTGRISETGPDDELKLLAVTFNNMIERLKISFDKQTAFVSDASHELKTPISVIQGYANLLDRWGKDDPEILQEAIASIKNETEHMAKLFKKLLFLSKGDQNALKGPMLIVSLNEIVQEVKKEFDICYSDRKIIVLEEGQMEITADYDLVKQLIWVFLDNSVKYSKNDSEIKLKVFQKGGKPAFSVEDNGIGLKDDELPYIFDRFYRADKSRSKAIPGTGLGLSIARLIVDIHQAKIKVESKAGEGTLIEVVWP